MQAHCNCHVHPSHRGQRRSITDCGLHVRRLHEPHHTRHHGGELLGSPKMDVFFKLWFITINDYVILVLYIKAMNIGWFVVPPILRNHPMGKNRDGWYSSLPRERDGWNSNFWKENQIVAFSRAIYGCTEASVVGFLRESFIRTPSSSALPETFVKFLADGQNNSHHHHQSAS